jgi:CRISPR/Cas system-associated endonuclease Cas1
MALDLFSHGILAPDSHFEKRDGGVFMTVEGKKRFFVAYERRMERGYTSEQHGERTTIRGELHRQCRLVKQAVLNGEPFEPFLMN